MTGSGRETLSRESKVAESVAAEFASRPKKRDKRQKARANTKNTPKVASKPHQ